MKLSIITLAIFSLLSSLNAQDLRNGAIYYDDINLKVEVYSTQRSLKKYSLDKDYKILGFFMVNSDNFYIYSEPNKRSEKKEKVGKGAFLKINKIDENGWAYVKDFGWVRGYLLYPKIAPTKTKNINDSRSLNKKKIYKNPVVKKKERVYALGMSKAYIFKSPTLKSKKNERVLKRKERIVVDKVTKYGWLHIKDGGWVRGYKFKEKKGVR